MTIRTPGRTIAAAAGLAVAAVLVGMAAEIEEAGDPAAPAPGDCIGAGLIVRAWHSEIVLPASAFAPRSAPRTLFSQAAAFAIGWGDEDAFVSGLTPARAVSALAWPTPSVVHVVARSGVPDGQGEGIAIALSQAGRDALVADIEAAIARDAAGEPIVVAPGRIAGRSVFVRGTQRYHALRTCNVWAAQTLDAAGLDIAWPALHPLPWTLTGEISLRAPAACPPS